MDYERLANEIKKLNPTAGIYYDEVMGVKMICGTVEAEKLTLPDGYHLDGIFITNKHATGSGRYDQVDYRRIKPKSWFARIFGK